MMDEFNLQSFPGRCRKSGSCICCEIDQKWKEGFAQKFQHFYVTVSALEKWVEENCEVGMMPDDVLRLFIEKEILGLDNLKDNLEV